MTPPTATDEVNTVQSGTNQDSGGCPDDLDPVPRRAAESVSVRKIAAAEGMDSSPVNLNTLAAARGIDREFAARELVTSQALDGGPTYIEQDWSNWLDDHGTGASVLKPENSDAIREALVRTVRDGKKIRAIGGGHSHSKVAKPREDERYIKLVWFEDDDGNPVYNGLTGILDSEWRKEDDDIDLHFPVENDFESPTLVRAAAGNTIKALNRGYLRERGLGLLNMGSYDAQTLAGAINTSTHGTGQAFGTLADVVQSVEMFTVMESTVSGEPVVRKFRIEPNAADAITDRQEFEGDVDKHGMTLIQDDDVFHSVVAGYGCMGVATAYTLTVTNKYFVRESTEVRTVDQLLNQGALNHFINKSNADHLQFTLNTPAVFSDFTLISDDVGIDLNPNTQAMVRWHERKEWEEQPSDWDDDNKWPPERRPKGPGSVARAIRTFISGGGVDPLTPNPGLGTLVNTYFSNQKGEQFTDERENNALLDALNLGDDSKRATTAYYIGLRRLIDKNADDPYKQPGGELDFATSMEIAVPIDQIGNVIDDVLTWVQEVNVTRGFLERIDYNPNKFDPQVVNTATPEVRFAGPIGVRFTASSGHFLTPEYSDGSSESPDTFAMIELPFLVEPVNGIGSKVKDLAKLFRYIGPPGAHLVAKPIADLLLPNQDIRQQEMLEIAAEAFPQVENRLYDKYDARPHMGKFSTIENGDLREMYPRFCTWKETYKTFNAFGTFNNGFTDRLALSIERQNGEAMTAYERNGGSS